MQYTGPHRAAVIFTRLILMHLLVRLSVYSFMFSINETASNLDYTASIGGIISELLIAWEAVVACFNAL
jgi:hypothetical protein